MTENITSNKVMTNCSRILVFIGCLSWLVIIAAYSIATGTIIELTNILYTGLVFSLTFSLVTILIMDFIILRFGHRIIFYTSLAGLIFFFFGNMFLLLNYYISPVMEAFPSMIKGIKVIAFFYRASNILPTILLTISLVLLAVTMFKIYKANKIIS